MRFHEVFLGYQHEIWSKQHNGKASGFLTRELGAFLLAGKQKPLVIHELLCRVGESDAQQRSLCTLFGEALEAYRRQAWDEVTTTHWNATRDREDARHKLGMNPYRVPDARRLSRLASQISDAPSARDRRTDTDYVHGDKTITVGVDMTSRPLAPQDK
jgi:hypothetical protein